MREFKSNSPAGKLACHYRSPTRGQSTRRVMKNVSAERAVIGALMVSQGKAMDSCVGVLDADSFTEVGLGAIYSTVLELFTQGKPADIVMIEEELTKQNRLDSIGGMTTLLSIIDDAVSASNIAFHVDLVRQAWCKRRALRELKRLEYVFTEHMDPYDQILATNHAMELVLSKTTHNHEIDTALQEAFNEIVPDVKWGWPMVDHMSNRVRRGEVSVVGGRPSNGKTSFMAATAANMLDDGKRVLFVSKEMPRQRILQKIIANRFGLTVKDMTNEERAEYFGRMKHLLETDWEGRLTIIDDVSNAFKVPHAIRQHKPDVILDDYIQFGLYGRDVRLDVTRAMNMYKTLARERNIAIVVAAQLNRVGQRRS